MRNLIFAVCSMVFASQAFAEFSFLSYSTGAKGSVNVTVQQGNTKIKFSANLSNMDIVEPYRDGFGFKLIEAAGVPTKGSCSTEIQGFERCSAVTVDAAVQTTVTISVNGKLSGYSDGQGSGGVTWVYQGLGKNLTLVQKEEHGLASVSKILGDDICGYSSTSAPTWCSTTSSAFYDIHMDSCVNLVGARADLICAAAE